MKDYKKIVEDLGKYVNRKDFRTGKGYFYSDEILLDKINIMKNSKKYNIEAEEIEISKDTMCAIGFRVKNLNKGDKVIIIKGEVMEKVELKIGRIETFWFTCPNCNYCNDDIYSLEKTIKCCQCKTEFFYECERQDADKPKWILLSEQVPTMEAVGEEVLLLDIRTGNLFLCLTEDILIEIENELIYFKWQAIELPEEE